MRIGIDISQTAYARTGVANLLKQLVVHLLKEDTENSYVLFFSSLRGKIDEEIIEAAKTNPRAHVQTAKIPPTVLDLLWNRLHIMPVEQLIGDVDVFISSDWTQPPTRRAIPVTIIYDLIVYKYPEETHNKTSFSPFTFLLSPNIVAVQKRRLQWVKKECQKILCISESTKLDCQNILGLEGEKLSVVYPGV